MTTSTISQQTISATYPAPVQRLISIVNTSEFAGEAADFEDFGRLIMALTASKSTGLSLILGLENGLNLAWIISGLPNDGKLLAMSEDQEQLAVLKSAMDTDLRVAFHSQDLASFVEDISHHRFNLIYCGEALDSQSSSLLQGMLMPAGLLITNPKQNSELLNFSEEVASLIPLPAPLDKDGLRLYIKGERPLKRRGGRKAKLDRPSLRTA